MTRKSQLDARTSSIAASKSMLPETLKLFSKPFPAVPGGRDENMKAQNRKKKTDRQTRFQKILVPIDFSTAGQKAFQYAADLAQQYRSNIVLLHIVAPSESGKMNAAVNTAKTNLDDLCKTQGGLSNRCKTIVRTGVPFFEITQSANSDGVDLIIVGRRDSTKANFGDGHTSARVVRYARCPVLIVSETDPRFRRTSDGN
jgi:nucleotide-binding universal stress UspA family protein